MGGVDDAIQKNASGVHIDPAKVRELADLIQTALENETDRQYIAEHVLWVLDQMSIRQKVRGGRALDHAGGLL